MRPETRGLAEFGALCRRGEEARRTGRRDAKLRQEEATRAARSGPGRRARYLGGLETSYELEEAQVVELFRESAGRCAICGLAFNRKAEAVVDHCHESGRVRGLLCARCNALLGFACDRRETLRAAAGYLERG